MAIGPDFTPRALIDWLSPDLLRVELRADSDDPAPLVARLRALDGVADAPCTRRVIGVLLDPATPDRGAIEHAVRALLNAPTPAAAGAPPRTIELPVRFDPPAAPDLDAVAALAGCTPTTVIDLLLAADLRVEFLGFMPGFPYMSGLPPALHLPRRESPRPRVPAGSLALAGAMCGVYPSSSPGGWHVVGRTAALLFDPARAEPATLRAGDRVRLVREGSTPCPSA